jgi:hypothetical protein
LLDTASSAHFLGNASLEPEAPVFILSGRLFQKESKMRNLLIAACCAALVGSVPVASAQTAPAAQDSMKTNNPMNANAKMKKKHTKKTAKSKSDDSMKGDTSSMKKDSK